MKTARIASLAVLLALPAAAQPRPADPAPPAPTRVAPGAKLYVEPTEFGMAFSAAILKKHVLEEPPPPSRVRPGVPPELDALVLHLLRKTPDERPAGAEALVIALRDFLRRAA